MTWNVALAVLNLISFGLMTLLCLAAGERQLARFGAAMLAAVNLICFVIMCARIFKEIR